MNLKHLLLAIVALPILFSCEKDVPITGIAVDPATLTLTEAGQTDTLTATLAPVDAKANVVWASSNTAIATVTGDGLTAVVTAVGDGTAKITATSDIFIAECTVTVNIGGSGGGEGDGTKAKPYSVAQVIALYSVVPYVQENDVWLGGYIVGGVKNGTFSSLATEGAAGYVFGTTDVRPAAVLIADSPDETNHTNVVVVKLTGETDPAHTVPVGYQDMINLNTKPCNVGHYLKIQGDLYRYFAVPSVRRVMDFEFTEQDCSGTSDPLHTAYVENFESFTSGTGNAYMNTQPDNKGWLDYSAQGTLLPDVRLYSNNKYVQFSAHRSSGVTAGAIQEMWLVSPRLDLTNATNKVLSFDMVGGYFNATTVFEAYVIEGNNPTLTTSNKVKLTGWTIPTEANLSGSYTPFINSGNIDLTAYSGIKRIAFYYKGTSGSGNSTTYQLDNFKLGN